MSGWKLETGARCVSICLLTTLNNEIDINKTQAMLRHSESHVRKPTGSHYTKIKILIPLFGI